MDPHLHLRPHGDGKSFTQIRSSLGRTRRTAGSTKDLHNPKETLFPERTSWDPEDFSGDQRDGLSPWVSVLSGSPRGRRTPTQRTPRPPTDHLNVCTTEVWTVTPPASLEMSRSTDGDGVQGARPQPYPHRNPPGRGRTTSST